LDGDFSKLGRDLTAILERKKSWNRLVVDKDYDFCVVWFGQKDGDGGRERMGKEERIPLPWGLLTPVLRILGHCIVGTRVNGGVFDAACRSLYARSIHDINARAILAIGSLLRLEKMDMEPSETLNWFHCSQ